MQLVPVEGQVLTPEQRKFNQLVAKIEKLRASLAEWQVQRPLAMQALVQRLRPLQLQIHERQRLLAEALERLIAEPAWTNAHRGLLKNELCELLEGMIDDALTGKAEAAELKAWYDRHAEQDFDAERQSSMEAMRAMVEHATGLDLGETDFADEDELLSHAHRRLHEQASDEAAAREAARAARPPRKLTAAQRRRAEEAEQAARSLREVYRKLASALHPDRAADEADRAKRTAMMARVNQANDAQDLLALFALQLEIEQVDAAHIARATAERARYYNQLLAAQVKALEEEIAAQEMAVRADFTLDPFAHLRPHQLSMLVEDEVRQLRAVVSHMDRDLKQLANPAGAKRWVQQVQRERKRMEGAFGSPF